MSELFVDGVFGTKAPKPNSSFLGFPLSWKQSFGSEEKNLEKDGLQVPKGNKRNKI